MGAGQVILNWGIILILLGVIVSSLARGVIVIPGLLGLTFLTLAIIAVVKNSALRAHYASKGIWR